MFHVSDTKIKSRGNLIPLLPQEQLKVISPPNVFTSITKLYKTIQPNEQHVWISITLGNIVFFLKLLWTFTHFISSFPLIHVDWNSRNFFSIFWFSSSSWIFSICSSRAFLKTDDPNSHLEQTNQPGGKRIS